MKKIIKSFLLILFLTKFTFGQTTTQALPATNPSIVGVSEERLDRLDEHIEKFVGEGHLPGGVFMIARKGKIIYDKTFGERKPGVSYEKDDIFRLASMTKAFTSVGIMQLVERGKLRLDDPIFYYIPEFRNAVVAENISQKDSSYTTRPVKKQVTIRHLLTHTSGITYGVFQGGAIQAMYEKFGANDVGFSHKTMSTLEMAHVIAETPLIFEPGSNYSYGLSMDVLGAIIEVVAELPLDQYIRENILNPLALDDTDYYLNVEKHDRLVPVYTFDKDRKVVVSEDSNLDYPKASGRTSFAGGAGMSGTAADYLVFIQALLNDGELNGQRILSRKSIDVMTSDQMITLNKEGNGYSKTPGLTYGLGFSLVTEEGRGVSMKSPGTYEWGGYFNTKFFIDPEEELIFVGMTQIVPFPRGDFWDKAYAIIYGALED